MNGRAWTAEALDAHIGPLPVPMAVARGELIVGVNDAFCRAMGLPRAEVVGSRWSPRISPEEQHRLSSRAERFERETSVMPVRLFGGGGRILHFVLHIARIPEEGGDELILATAIERPESHRREWLTGLLARVSSALIAVDTEAEARAAALAAFASAGLRARFLSGRDLPEGDEEAALALVQEGLVFGGAASPLPDRVLLPIVGPDGTELLELGGSHFDPLDGSSWELFGGLLGAALQAQRRMSDTRLLLDLAGTLSGTLELTEILETACDFLVLLLDLSNAFVLLLDDSGRNLVGAAGSARHREFIRTVQIPLDHPGVVGTAARTRRPCILEDIEAADKAGRFDISRSLGEKAVIALPLMRRDELLGVVVLDDTRRSRGFSPELIERASVSIGQIALSVSNARLYESLRQSYVELEAARAEVVKRERLAALGELSAVVAHEVRNPLGVIFNAVSSLRRAAASTRGLPDVQMLLDVVAEESDRLNRIVTELLDFARPLTLAAQPEEIAPLLMESVDAARFVDGGAHEGRFELEVPPDLPPVVVDRHQFRQALINVMVNALQAMPKGGRVLVRAALDPEEESDPPRLCLEIADEGQGIAPDLLRRVFEPFFTTKARGTGLGLAVVKRIVEEHRGEVLVRSVLGRGTTFVFRLPLARAGC